jgi:tRNA 2-thiouridine synthesizing protein E
MAIKVNGITIKTNTEGFLLDAGAWNEDVAEKIGDAHGVKLTEAHWEVISLVRNYCEQGNEPPSMRTLVKVVKLRLDQNKAKSIYLMKLFGASPAKMVARLAGLPKPKNCL